MIIPLNWIKIWEHFFGSKVFLWLYLSVRKFIQDSKYHKQRNRDSVKCLKKWRHTIKLTNEGLVYLLPLVNYSVYWPLIGQVIEWRHFLVAPYAVSKKSLTFVKWRILRFKNTTSLCLLKSLGTLINLDWVVKHFKPMFLMYKKYDFVNHNWGCTSIKH